MQEGSVVDRMSTAELARRRSEMVAAFDRVTDTDELLRVMSDRLGALVPFDSSCWFGTDPETHFASLPVRIENIAQGHCTTYWDREFSVDDVLLFTAMVNDGVNAATLLSATDGLPARSARYREFLAPQNLGDEMRMTLRANGSTWGLIAIMRDTSAGPFTARETAFVAGITQHMAKVLRRNNLLRTARTVDGVDAPGVILFDETGALSSMNEAATAWLDELGAGITHPDDMPVSVVAVLAHARAVARGRQRGSAMLRVRGLSGQWATLHASRLGGDDSGAGERAPGGAYDIRSLASSLTRGPMVVVVEKAAPSQLRSIVEQAFGLSAREQQVTARLTRGLSTAAIARELYLSEHTVRDHVKSILAKVGVANRSELVAFLYAEHFAPDHADAVQVG